MQDDDALLLQSLGDAVPLPSLRTRLAWTAAVDCDPREDLGPSPLGARFVVPITGGRFWGGPGFEALRGRVRAGGADRQLLRADGVKELRAEYDMETDDGAVLTVLNEVVVDDTVQPQRYALSRIRVTAPDGPHAWLNRRLFLGTLQALRPQRQAVLIRGWLVEQPA